MTVALWLAFALFEGVGMADEKAQGGLLRQLQFSPDGKYILAQDDSGITVLAVDPLCVRFRVPADPQVLARFTPDSREIVFVHSMRRVVRGEEVQLPQGNPKVERWRISDCSKVAVVPIPDLACGTAALAPDGRTLACDDIRGTLHVVEVASGLESLAKKKFALPMFTDDGYFQKKPHLWAGDFEFSPDGHVLIAVPDDSGPAVLWDSNGRKLVKSQGEIKLLSTPGVAPASWAQPGSPAAASASAAAKDKLILRTDSFAFASPDELAIVRARWLSWKEGSNCSVVIVTFPAGKAVSSRELPHCPGGLTFGSGRIQRPFRRAADPEVFIVDYEITVFNSGVGGVVMDNWAMSPLKVGNYYPERTATIATLAVVLRTGQIIQSHSAAFDVYGNRYVEEVHPGEVGLSEIGKGLQASVVVSTHGK